MRPTTPRPATASAHDLQSRHADDRHDRRDPRIHSAPATPAKPFTATPQFWLAGAVLVLGLVLAGVAQPAMLSSSLPGWMLPVGYFTAVFGAAAMALSWVLYRAR